MLAQPNELLVTLLVGITVVNIGASALAAAIAEQLFGGMGLPIAIGAMVFLLTVFGEVLPMTLAVEHPLRFASWVNRPVAWLSVLLKPIRVGLGAFTAVTLRLVGSERQTGQPEISEEELRTLVDVGAREGVVDRTEREMIHKVFELEDTLVREVMVPRPDMFCLDVSMPPEEILPRLREQLHSRVPVFEETIDQIVGVLYTKDLLPHLDGLPPTFELRAHLHPPYFVPESKRADALLREFQAKKLHLAIVVDEYGGTAGLVTLEDLLEELVGRDPRRVRRGRAPDPAASARGASGSPAGSRSTSSTPRPASRSPTRPSTRWAAGCSTSSAACPTGARRRRPRTGCACRWRRWSGRACSRCWSPCPRSPGRRRRT